MVDLLAAEIGREDQPAVGFDPAKYDAPPRRRAGRRDGGQHRHRAAVAVFRLQRRDEPITPDHIPGSLAGSGLAGGAGVAGASAFFFFSAFTGSFTPAFFSSSSAVFMRWNSV